LPENQKIQKNDSKNFEKIVSWGLKKIMQMYDICIEYIKTHSRYLESESGYEEKD